MDGGWMDGWATILRTEVGQRADDGRRETIVEGTGALLLQDDAAAVGYVLVCARTRRTRDLHAPTNGVEGVGERVREGAGSGAVDERPERGGAALVVAWQPAL